MPLRLVPPSEPSPVERVTLRVKAMPRRSGAVQCPRCGGRTTIKVTNGDYIQNNRKHTGTVILEGACYDCERQGITTFMTSDIKPVK